MKQFHNFSIATKMFIAIAIFSVPVAQLAYYLYVEKQDLISFARQEVAGVQYLRAAHSSLAAATAVPQNKELYVKAAEELEKAEKNDGGQTNVTSKTHDLVGMLKNAAQDKDGGDIAGKSAELISLISDNSNITLDPDGDAYFVGDIIVNQSTGVVSQLYNLIKTSKDLDATASDDNKIAYAEARDGLATSAGNLATDLGKAIKGNADGAIKQFLEADAKPVADSAAKLAELSKTTDRTALTDEATGLYQKMQGFIAKNNDEMERLLNARIDGFYKVLFERLGLSAAGVIIGAFIFWVIVRSIIQPISTITKLMGRLTNGELDMEIPKMDRRDEIGTLAVSLNAFHDAALEREKARKAEDERMAKEKLRAEHIQKITSDFEMKVKGIVATVASASTELAHTAEEVTKVMKQTAENAKNAATSSMQTTTNVQAVASAAEELSASVKEISSQVQRTNNLAHDSRDQSEAADVKASTLGVAAHKVSEAVTLIASIAGQINLLALNATIESARAGEAGKGFAVVASEVKNLANQTNKSVEDVSKVIEEVNSASQSIIDALHSIKESVSNVSSASANIAAAVEEQSATTNEITRNMQSAADGTQVISQNLELVSASSANAFASANEVLSAAQELSRQSEALNKEVVEFLHAVRVA